MKLLGGTIGVLLILASGLVLLAGIVLGPNEPSGSRVLLLAVGASGIALGSVLAIISGRRPAEEATLLRNDPYARAFLRRKLAFRVSLIIPIVLSAAAVISANGASGAAAAALMLAAPIILIGGYLMLRYVLWRCPRCGSRMPSTIQGSAFRSVTFKICPDCGARLN